MVRCFFQKFVQNPPRSDGRDGVHMSVNAARMSACATLFGADGGGRVDLEGADSGGEAAG